MDYRVFQTICKTKGIRENIPEQLDIVFLIFIFLWIGFDIIFYLSLLAYTPRLMKISFLKFTFQTIFMYLFILKNLIKKWFSIKKIA
jgi:hypothetical protein